MLLESQTVITINPDLFKTSKTKKNRSSEKPKVSIPKPIIKPNTIKQKFKKNKSTATAAQLLQSIFYNVNLFTMK